MKLLFHVWCLDWDEKEDDATEVWAYDPLAVGWRDRGEKRRVWVAFKASLTPMEAAEATAAHYHTHRDAWEASWPLVFRVKGQTGETFDIEVERDIAPIFNGSLVKPREATP